MERSIIALRWYDKVTNSQMRKVMQMEDVGYKTKKLKSKFAGYVAREVGQKWNQKFWIGNPMKTWGIAVDLLWDGGISSIRSLAKLHDLSQSVTDRLTCIDRPADRVIIDNKNYWFLTSLLSPSTGHLKQCWYPIFWPSSEKISQIPLSISEGIISRSQWWPEHSFQRRHRVYAFYPTM